MLDCVSRLRLAVHLTTIGFSLLYVDRFNTDDWGGRNVARIILLLVPAPRRYEFITVFPLG